MLKTKILVVTFFLFTIAILGLKIIDMEDAKQSNIEVNIAGMNNSKSSMKIKEQIKVGKGTLYKVKVRTGVNCYVIQSSTTGDMGISCE